MDKLEEKEKQAQEIYMQFQLMEQQIKQLQREYEMVSQQLIELTVAGNGLDEFGNIKPKKEAFVPISSGIFVKAGIENTSELFVNVGANVVVKKDVKSAKELISRQVEEIRKVQVQMGEELEKAVHHAGELEKQLHGLIH